MVRMRLKPPCQRSMIMFALSSATLKSRSFRFLGVILVCTLVILIGTTVARWSLAADVPAVKAPEAIVEFSGDGKLKRPPVAYRKWVQVGTPLTPKELNDGGAAEFHAVYMDPE